MLQHFLLKYWKVAFCAVFPILLSPLIFVNDDSQKFKCLFVILLMGSCWMLEALPLAVTGLLPVAFFPLLGIASTSQVASNYMRETGMMFIGGISLALAIEKSFLHKRIALNMMLLIGVGAWRTLFGIMATTFVLSCWIVGSTAVTAMMIPIVSGLVECIEADEGLEDMRIVYMLAVGYAANIGGTAVIIGSTPNLVFRDLVEAEDVGQGGKYTDVNFVTWIAFNMPIAVINLIIVWVYLCLLYQRRKRSIAKGIMMNTVTTVTGSTSISSSISIENRQGFDDNSKSKVRDVLKLKLKDMGPMTFHEKSVCVLFGIATILWFTRSPGIFRGWMDLMFPDKHISVGDSTVAIVILLLMFVIPSSWSKKTGEDYETIMTWKYLQSHFPWDVVILVGGGFAISDGAERSGLSTWIGEQLNGLQYLPAPLLLYVILLVISLFTEVMSNAATISLLTPILFSLSRSLGLHPLYLSFAGAVACQYAFILPTSNPSNAIVFGAGRMRILDMVKPGLPLNILCLSILYIMNITWGQLLFKFNDYEYPRDVNSTQSLS